MRNGIAILAAAAMLAACDNTTGPGGADYVSLPADNVVLGLTQNISESGVRRAHLTADTALVFNDSSATHLRNVRLEIFNEEGRPRATVTSLRGEYNSTTMRTVARGDVVLVVPGEDGRTIYTEELFYDPQTKRVWSDVPTRMVTANGQEMRGQRFTADDQFININIPGGAGDNIPLPIGNE